MQNVIFPYGKEKWSYQFDENELLAVLESPINQYEPLCSGGELIRRAMENPTGGERLCELARGKHNIVIIASDHTRPVPSKLIIPVMLREIRSTSPEAAITILIATGCHRGTTKQELIDKFGEEIVAREHIYIHDCDERDMLVNIGTLPSGGECEINRIAYEADLLCAEGFIEPHFLRGFPVAGKVCCPVLPEGQQYWQTIAQSLLTVPMQGRVFWKATRFIRICCGRQKRQSLVIS